MNKKCLFCKSQVVDGYCSNRICGSVFDFDPNGKVIAYFIPIKEENQEEEYCHAVYSVLYKRNSKTVLIECLFGSKIKFVPIELPEDINNPNITPTNFFQKLDKLLSFQ